MVSAVIADKIYIAGGNSDTNLQLYDPATNTWTTLASMPAGRYGGAAGVIGGKLYVAGGLELDNVRATLFVYDPATNAWSMLTPMPTARFFANSGVINGKLYVAVHIGGK